MPDPRPDERHLALKVVMMPRDTKARMLITIAPAGLEKMFLEVGQPVAEGAETPVTMLIERSHGEALETMMPTRPDNGKKV